MKAYEYVAYVFMLTEILSCDETECTNSVECLEENGDLVCICEEGYVGELCDEGNVY